MSPSSPDQKDTPQTDQQRTSTSITDHLPTGFHPVRGIVGGIIGYAMMQHAQSMYLDAAFTGETSMWPAYLLEYGGLAILLALPLWYLVGSPLYHYLNENESRTRQRLSYVGMALPALWILFVLLLFIQNPVASALAENTTSNSGGDGNGIEVNASGLDDAGMDDQTVERPGTPIADQVEAGDFSIDNITPAVSDEVPQSFGPRPVLRITYSHKEFLTGSDAAIRVMGPEDAVLDERRLSEDGQVHLAIARHAPSGGQYQIQVTDGSEVLIEATRTFDGPNIEVNDIVVSTEPFMTGEYVEDSYTVNTVTFDVRNTGDLPVVEIGPTSLINGEAIIDYESHTLEPTENRRVSVDDGMKRVDPGSNRVKVEINAGDNVLTSTSSTFST